MNVLENDTIAGLVKTCTKVELFFLQIKCTKLIYISFWFETN